MRCYVAGYATGNDFTARDLQFDTGGQWMVGKTPDSFAPLALISSPLSRSIPTI